MKNRQRVPIVLATLLAYSTLLPIFWGYLFSFILLCWVSWRLRRRFVANLCRAAWRARGVKYGVLGKSALTMPRDPVRVCLLLCGIGVSTHLISLVSSEWLSLWFSDYAGSGGRMLKAMSHVVLKQGLLWMVIAWFFTLIHARRIDVNRLALPLLGFLSLYVIYVLLQRSYGIHWSQGFEARLPANRFAYGVFRASGFMDHPLTFSYNLVFMAVISFGMTRYGQGSRGEKRCWAACAAIATLMVVLTGSRFPLIVLIAVLTLTEARSFWQWRYYISAIVAFGALFLWWEQSILGRMFEVLGAATGGLEGIDRFRFWRVHWFIFQDYPVVGVGMAWIKTALFDYYTALGYHDKMYSAHNIYLQTLADSGFVGFVGLGGLMLSFFAACRLHMNQLRNRLLLKVLLVVVLSGLMQNNLRDSEFLMAFWYWAAFAAVADPFKVSVGSET